MPHGKTRLMRNIRNSVPQATFAEHEDPSREMRRHPLQTDFHRDPRKRYGVRRFQPKDVQDPSGNVPYVNPARDQKRGRRLRAELR